MVMENHHRLFVISEQGKNNLNKGSGSHYSQLFDGTRCRGKLCDISNIMVLSVQIRDVGSSMMQCQPGPSLLFPVCKHLNQLMWICEL